MRAECKAKVVVVDGIRFVLDAKSRYYRANTPNGVHKTALLHRYLWERENGPVPKGCQIHHADGNRENNAISNLVMLTAEEHREYHKLHPTKKALDAWHNNIEIARVAASAWHRSEEGRAWHRLNAIKNNRPQERHECKCEECGKIYMGVAYQKFCTSKCKQRWRRKSGVDDVVKKCPICGKTFTSNKFDHAETCSRSCANRIRSRRRKCV